MLAAFIRSWGWRGVTRTGERTETRVYDYGCVSLPSVTEPKQKVPVCSLEKNVTSVGSEEPIPPPQHSHTHKHTHTCSHTARLDSIPTSEMPINTGLWVKPGAAHRGSEVPKSGNDVSSPALRSNSRPTVPGEERGRRMRSRPLDNASFLTDFHRV